MRPHFEQPGRPKPTAGTIRRILVDCSFTYRSPDALTGIPRVVRNVVACAPQAAEALGVQWNTVLLSEGQWRPVRWRLPRDVVEMSGLKKHLFQVSQRVGRRLRKTFVPRTLVRWAAKGISRVLPVTRGNEAIDFGPGDLLLLLDGYWTYPNLDLSVIRRSGAAIGLVAYDLTPIVWSQYHTPQLVKEFVTRLHEVIPHVDCVVSISRTVCEEVRQYVQQQFPDLHFPSEAFSWFPLGTRLDMAQRSGTVCPQVKEAFQGKCPPYLCVATIEPRKNHKGILDAFDRLWSQLPDVRLCLVGRRGWMADDIAARIRKHPRQGRQLFWFEGLSDTELDYCYRRAKALVYASFAEGFGLPIAEALQHGLPVLASGIPVHREVGGEFCAYFDPSRPETLTRLITEFEQGGRWSGVRPASEFRATDWESSTKRLFEECLTRCGAPRTRTPRLLGDRVSY